MKFQSIIFSLIVVLMVSCQESTNKTSSSSEQDYVEARDLGLKLKLPENFKAPSYHESQVLINNYDGPEELAENRLRMIRSIQEGKRKGSVFMDTTNFENFMYIIETEHVRFRKEDVGRMVGAMEKDFVASFKQGGIDIERIENRVIGLEKAPMVKVKYELKVGPMKFYITRYLISTDTRTFMVSAFSDEGKDYEESLKTIRIGEE
jgi:hypothetical protein